MPLVHVGVHSIYYHVFGTGVPVVVVHGGPGSGMSVDLIETLFDLEKFKVVAFDQRGCGKSTPLRELEGNNTQALISDMELIRQTLEIDRWYVFGGSWGSTLSLAYAQAHPEQTLGLVIYGVFLATQQELEGMYFPGGLVSTIFPEAFETFISELDEIGRANPILGYQKLFREGNEETRTQALKKWTWFEKRISRLETHGLEDFDTWCNGLGGEELEYVYNHSTLECHYFAHNGFIEADALLHSIQHSDSSSYPVYIVQGRYDMVCPFKAAYAVHSSFQMACQVPASSGMHYPKTAGGEVGKVGKGPGRSSLYCISNAGHSYKEAATTAALVSILQSLPKP